MFSLCRLIVVMASMISALIWTFFFIFNGVGQKEVEVVSTLALGLTPDFGLIAPLGGTYLMLGKMFFPCPLP